MWYDIISFSTKKNIEKKNLLRKISTNKSSIGVMRYRAIAFQWPINKRFSDTKKIKWAKAIQLNHFGLSKWNYQNNKKEMKSMKKKLFIWRIQARDHALPCVFSIFCLCLCCLRVCLPSMWIHSTLDQLCARVNVLVCFRYAFGFQLFCFIHRY